MSFSYNEENLTKFKELLPRYPHKKALTLPCLWMAQYQEGFISADAMTYIAELLDVPAGHLYGVATFYTMFELEEIAPFHIQVCKTLSCELCGKSDLIKAIEEETGLKVGDSNKTFKLTEVECLGACGGAPMLAMNEDYYENLDASKTKELLKRLSNDN